VPRIKGFTLLELVIALGILSFGFLSLLHLSISAMKANQYSRNKTAALQLAQEKMEILKTLPFSDLQGEWETGLKIGTMGTVFQRETRVQKDLEGAWADITVRVFWPGFSGPDHSAWAEIFTRIAA
jgi:prepilin-type N-terminal cleavage/methylation domain-containing protein